MAEWRPVTVIQRHSAVLIAEEDAERLTNLRRICCCWRCGGCTCCRRRLSTSATIPTTSSPRAADMRAVAVGWSLRARESLPAHHPDAFIDTPGDLLALLPSVSTPR